MMLILSILILFLRLSFSSSLPEFNEPCYFKHDCRDISGPTTPGNASLECCSPCSCSEACTLTGVCCLGNNTTPRSTPSFPCRRQTFIFSKYLNRTVVVIKELAYRVIDECDVDYETEEGNEEIITRCKQAKEMEDLIFVTGLQSGLTYLNEHCARCNGEDDLVHWDLYLTDRANDLVLSSFEERDEMLLRKSSFKVIPPSVHVALLSFCSIESISRCNETGLWDYYDKDLERNCMSYHSYFSAEYLNQRKTFLNIYCFMCNSPKGTRTPNQCTIPDEINEVVNLAPKGGFVPSFNALMIPSKKTSDRPAQQTCSTGEILNIFTKRCTPLICPPGTIPDHGVCQPAMGQVTGYVVMLRLEIVIHSKADLQRADYTMLLADLKHFAKRITRNRDRKCGICSMGLIRLPDETIVWLLYIKSGEKCDYIALLENIFLTCKTFPVVFFSEYLKSNVTVSDRNADIHYGSVENLDKSQTFQICHTNIVYTPTVVHCPSLIFNKTNMSEKCDDSCFHTKIDPFSVHLGNGTYIICVDLYKKALSSLNQACVIGFDESVMSILVTFYILNQLLYR